jgi:hypothetical protein
MDKIVNQYNKLFDEFSKTRDDNETNHVVQDKIYRKFINDIQNNKLKSYDEIKKISELVKKHIVNYDKNRWYS